MEKKTKIQFTEIASLSILVMPFKNDQRICKLIKHRPSQENRFNGGLSQGVYVNYQSPDRSGQSFDF